MNLFKNIALWAGLLCLLSPTLTLATDKKEFVRLVKKEFLGMSARTTMQLYNQYGKINIRPAGDLNANVSVRIAVFATDEAAAEKVFKRIKINFDNTGTWAKAETIIENDNSWGWDNGGSSYSIDYDVSLPTVANLDLRNQYGHSTIPDMSSSVKASAEYGNLTFGNMTGPLNVRVQYGKVNIAGSRDATFATEYTDITYSGEAGNININAQYGDVAIADAADLLLEAEYVNFNIGHVKNIKASLQYGDVRIASTKTLTVKSEYTNFRIASLTNKLDCNSIYGDVAIDRLDKAFGSINFVGEYTGLQITVPEGTSFAYDLKGEYARFSLPAGAKPTNSNKTDYENHWWGNIGTGAAKITARSTYGNISIR